MGMNLARVTRAALERVARESGLSLTVEQVRDIAETERVCLAECGRLSFGESTAVRIAREFASSPFIAGNGAEDTLMELVETFYELREDFPATVTDTEILEALRKTFDGDAAGDAGIAVAMAREALSERLIYEAYEIADADGNVYRWNPDEWHDDVMANGWYGERWEDADGWCGGRREDADE